MSQWESAVALESDDPRCCIFSHSAKDNLASRSCPAPSRLYNLPVSSALCSPWFSPEKAILNICSRYTGTPALRHFVIRQRTGIHPSLCLQLPSAPRVRRELYSTSLIVRTGRLLVRKCHAQTNTLLMFDVIAVAYKTIDSLSPHHDFTCLN